MHPTSESGGKGGGDYPIKDWDNAVIELSRLLTSGK